MLEDLGLSSEKLEASGALEKMLSWQKSDLPPPIAVPYGNSSIYTEAHLAFRTDDDGNIGLAVHAMRKEPQLDFPYMGYKFSPEDKAQLLKTGQPRQDHRSRHQAGRALRCLRIHRPTDQRAPCLTCGPSIRPQRDQRGDAL